MKLNHLKLFFIAILAIGFLSCSKSKNETISKTLYQDFQNPPNEACPRVWWHWMNGNVTKDGIRKDLEWMNRVGIGGFQNFDAGLTTPQIVEKRLSYMTPEWKDAFQFTTKLADSLDLEIAIAGSPGWSETGGPWVEAKDGMKKLVWSELKVEGGKTFSGKLPDPPAVTSVFQNLELGSEVDALSGEVPTPPAYYEDVAVIACKIPSTHIAFKELNPKVTSSGGSFTINQLTDGDLVTSKLLPINPSDDYAWIQFEFSQPQTIKAVSLVGGEGVGALSQIVGSDPEARFLEASNDGKNYTRVSNLPIGEFPQFSINIDPTTAKYFRVCYKNPKAMPSLGMDVSVFGMGANQDGPEGTEVAEIVLYPHSIIDRYEEKAGYSAYSETEPLTKADQVDVIKFSDVVDITDKMSNDGTLNWTPSAGKWTIIRYGFSLTGKQNHPASYEATGLEVDKMDREAVRRYLENYLEQYKEATGGLMGNKGLQYLIFDSYEAGQANWTPEMAQEFEERRGYSLYEWLPVITGKIVKGADESEKFLWDYRQTIAELIAENHYDNLTEILDKYGMKRYTESHENRRAYIVDGMDVKRTAAIPMSACWVGNLFGGSQIMHVADIRESASVSHIYGQNMVAAESFTAVGLLGNAFSYHPENLKPTADLELASGLNRFVIHTSVHQPVDDKVPGLGLSIFGQWFTRHETWAELAKAWTDYLARSSYMLQQGKFVADIVYYYGEDNNITSLFGQQLPDIPEGYNFDFINPHALINLLEVDNGNL
ncbi:MAG: glycosyl hydrolase, partial [Draconibacterium sp.]